MSEPASVKDLIEAATGIPADVQKLTFGRRGPLEDPKKQLHRCDIGHGALLYLSIKKTGTCEEGQFLASPALRKHYNVNQPWESIDDFLKSRTTVGSRSANQVLEP